MELTLDQALQKGIEAHKAGKVQEADRYYTAILKANPKHPDANHNMGVLAVGVGKVQEALPFFKAALDANPKIDQFWLSYIDTLIKLGRLADAKAVFDQAKSKGVTSDGFDQIEHKFGRPIPRNLNTLEPSREQVTALIKLYNQNRLEQVFEEALKLTKRFTKSLTVWNLLGASAAQIGKLDDAIVAFQKALTIKPDDAEAYNNIGNTLQHQGKLDKAIEAYIKALSIKPDYAEAYNNMGGSLQAQGKLEKAMEAYYKAISLKPNYAEAWNNIYFPLQALKTKISPNENINVRYPRNINSNSAKIELALLSYKLHRGQKNEGIYLDKAMRILSNADTITIKNPKFEKKLKGKVQTLPKRMVALIHFGRSGTGLMHSLIDGHPNVSTLPSIYFSEYFDYSTWTQIISDGWNGMVDQFTSLYDILFDANSSMPVFSKSKTLQHNIGITDGMVAVGDQKDEVLSVDKDLFSLELKKLMACYGELDASVFFKLVHLAYHKALNDLNPKSIIFYHVHNPDAGAKLNFARLHPSARWLIMVREPMQSCESWIRRSFHKNDYFGVVHRILTMLFEIDNSIHRRQNTIGVRLEDLKIKPKETIPALCKWMGIEEHEQLYKMTAQNKKWWGDPNSPDYEKDGYDPFGKTSIERKVGSIFSKKDQFIIGTLFYPFSVRFGYVNENFAQFRENLQIVRPFLNETFDFEKKILERVSHGIESVINSGSYVYLRSGLIERWNTLNMYQTYPGMIKPLKI